MGIMEIGRRTGYVAPSTEVIVTGTGIPSIDLKRAGAGVLIRHEDIAIHFDAGRGTAARVVEAGTDFTDLNAIFLTHYHSDHLVGLSDFLLSRWIEEDFGSPASLALVAPNGATVRHCEKLFALWSEDLAVRAGHNGRSPDLGVELIGFDTPTSVVEVWSAGDVRVLAGPVRHEPVEGAVGYRVETPDGVVAITGDTLVCDEVAELCRGADVVVYEATRFDQMMKLPSELHFIVYYHADTKLIGPQMEGLGIATVLLTHLIPPPATAEEQLGFETDLREGGYTGRVIVCDDLDGIALDGTQFHGGHSR